MNIKVRPCAGPGDLENMKQVLREGRRASPHSGYIHPGDLDWWVFYLLREERLGDIAFLWEDMGGSVVGWSLLSPRLGAFDLFVHPERRDGAAREHMLAWTEDRAAHIARQDDKSRIRTTWVFEDDAVWISLLEKRGFVREADTFYHYLVHPLGVLDEPRVPDGFILRYMNGTPDIEARAAAHRAAFQSGRMTADAYRYFRQAPGYREDLDRIAVAPDGTVAAFAMGWLDAGTRVGEFEPVGTQPGFRRQGLGRAVILDGLRHLKACGAEYAIVCAEGTHPAGRALYASAGFFPVNRIYSYVKEV